LPSLPSNVLGARFALEPDTKMMLTIVTATNVAAIVQGLRLCRLRSESFGVKPLTCSLRHDFSAGESTRLDPPR
jgi:hypothetical protein